MIVKDHSGPLKFSLADTTPATINAGAHQELARVASGCAKGENSRPSKIVAIAIRTRPKAGGRSKPSRYARPIHVPKTKCSKIGEVQNHRINGREGARLPMAISESRIALTITTDTRRDAKTVAAKIT